MRFLQTLTVFAIRPTAKTVKLTLIWTLLMLICEMGSLLDGMEFLRAGVWLLLIVAMAFLAMLVYEYLRLMQAISMVADLRIERQLVNNLPVYEHTRATLVICPNTDVDFDAGLVFTLTEHTPNNLQALGLPAIIYSDEFDGIHGQSVSYELYARERGVANFGGIDWLICTRFGLLSKFYHTPIDAILGTSEVRVLANFKAVIQGNIFAISKHSNLGGIIKKRRRGQGQDFHQIRAYLEGDSIRHIDWKATARHQHLMSREFQDEADQEILFLLDCGQHMRHIRFSDDTQLQKIYKEDGETLEHIGHLDMALNAMLLLAEVANRQNDATGFISFGAVQDKTAVPKKGVRAISYLLNQSFDLIASMKAPDYMAAARQALSLQKRRSLIILITNVRNDDTDELTAAIQLLTQKHRVIIANLTEHDVIEYLDELPKSHDDALTYHSVRSYLNDQKQLSVRLADETGALMFHCTPNELPMRLVESYYVARKWGVA